MLLETEITPITLKSRADHTEGIYPSQDYVAIA